MLLPFWQVCCQPETVSSAYWDLLWFITLSRFGGFFKNVLVICLWELLMCLWELIQKWSLSSAGKGWNRLKGLKLRGRARMPEKDLPKLFWANLPQCLGLIFWLKRVRITRLIIRSDRLMSQDSSMRKQKTFIHKTQYSQIKRNKSRSIKTLN